MRTMQDRITDHESPTDADLDALRAKVEAGGEFPVMAAAEVRWLISEIEFLRDELTTVRHAAETASKSIKAALADLKGEL